MSSESLHTSTEDRLAFEQACRRIYDEGLKLYRDLPWRNTRDAYEIWISEVMLQQTQVSRVDGRWQNWLKRFPVAEVLAEASAAEVLDEWQGLGYNRRAIALQKAAQEICQKYGGKLPQALSDLVKLPSIGPATAAGIRAFAFDLPGIYLETNVRAVMMHEFFAEVVDVPEKEIAHATEMSCTVATDLGISPRSWYYALLDYGFMLKKQHQNPNRRARSYSKQSCFEGSWRQKRSALVRILLSAHKQQGQRILSLEEAAEELNKLELAAGRTELDLDQVHKLLDELVRDGMCQATGSGWLV